MTELRGSWLKLWWSDRTARAAVLAALLILGMGSLRPRPSSGMYLMEYWAQKLQWHACADVVLTGDSRVIQGVSPREMGKFLPGLRIYNYGFGANGYSQAYLEATVAVLDPASKNRTIILGISPLSLTKVALVRNTFNEWRGRSATDLFLARKIPALMSFFAPMSFNTAWRGLFPDPKQYRAAGRFPDGWFWAVRWPEKLGRYLETYRRCFTASPVDEQVVQRVLAFTRRCRAHGIRVYGFRPPSSVPMVALENRVSGYLEARFPQRFEAAGGIWIEMDQTKYHSYDGSHLVRDAALRMTRDLARAIAAHQARRAERATADARAADAH